MERVPPQKLLAADDKIIPRYKLANDISKQLSLRDKNWFVKKCFYFYQNTNNE